MPRPRPAVPHATTRTSGYPPTSTFFPAYSPREGRGREACIVQGLSRRSTRREHLSLRDLHDRGPKLKTLSDLFVNHELLSDAGVGVLAIDDQGQIEYANEPAARIYARSTAAKVTGRTLRDVLPKKAAEERLAIAQQVIATGQPASVYDLWSGLALRAMVRRLSPCARTHKTTAAVIFRRESELGEGVVGPGDESAPAARVVCTVEWDLGLFKSLSSRELEVLALISEGYSNAQIAERLHRTVKTVEFHRSTIGQKTGVENRVKLAVLAQQAGLYERLWGNKAWASGRAELADAAKASPTAPARATANNHNSHAANQGAQLN